MHSWTEISESMTATYTDVRFSLAWLLLQKVPLISPEQLPEFRQIRGCLHNDFTRYCRSHDDPSRKCAIWREHRSYRSSLHPTGPTGLGAGVATLWGPR